jgi:hypothetical protein
MSCADESPASMTLTVRPMVPRDVARFVRFACFAATVALSASGLPSGAPEAPPVLDPGGHGAKPLPPPLQDFVTRVARLTEEQRRNLDEGKPVSRLLDADPSKEVAIFGAVWIASSMQRYVRAIADIENFEKGGSFRLTRRISSPPRLEDFAGLRVPQDDLAALPRCRVGHCDLQLGEQALGRLQTEVDWKASDAVDRANALVRHLALEYVTGYLEGGNERLAVYRDRERPTFVAREFTRMIDQMPELTAYVPDLRPYLLEYPRVALPGATSFLYWQETEFGLKPTIRISHLTIHPGRGDTVVVASKMLYASHYFWTGLELRALVHDAGRGPGFWFVTVNRSRSDGLGGVRGALLRGIVHRNVQDGMLDVLGRTKRRLEQSG